MTVWAVVNMDGSIRVDAMGRLQIFAEKYQALNQSYPEHGYERVKQIAIGYEVRA